jgi:hypothetical protein
MLPLVPPGNLTRFWGPNPKPVSTGGFEVKTIKTTGEAYPLCLLHDLDTCHCSPRPLDHQVLLHLRLTWLTAILTWSTQSTPLHVLLLVDVPQVSTSNGQSSDHLGPLVQASHPSFTTPSPSTRHVSTWPSLCQTVVSVLYTCTPTSQETCCTHTYVVVSLQAQPKLIISWQSLITTRHQGNISTMCSDICVLLYRRLLIRRGRQP